MLRRNIIEKLIKQSNKQTLSILIGSRQTGKTTLMGMIRDQLDTESSWYNLENPSHLHIFNEGYNSFISQNKTNLVFIDEFQYCDNISSIFKAIYDLHPEIKIYASGSSSLEIQTHLKESLVGRQMQTIVYPLSFSEWLGAFENLPPQIPAIGEIPNIDIQQLYRSHMAEFIQFGGMPGLYNTDTEIEKREYLHGIYQTYIAKDIKSFLKDESVLSFNKMIQYLAIHNGSQLNKNTLSTTAGVSSRQIERYIEILEGTFVLSLVKPLSKNRGKELTKTPKYYLYDQGLVNAIVQDFRSQHLRADVGVLHEQFVYWELKKNLDIRYNIKYWRTADGKEVDFVLEKDTELLPIEVKTQWPKEKIPPGILHFFSYYPEVKEAIVLYDGPETKIRHQDKTINFIPLYKACKIEY